MQPTIVTIQKNQIEEKKKKKTAIQTRTQSLLLPFEWCAQCIKGRAKGGSFQTIPKMLARFALSE